MNEIYFFVDFSITVNQYVRPFFYHTSCLFPKESGFARAKCRDAHAYTVRIIDPPVYACI